MLEGMTKKTKHATRILRRPEVERLTGLRKSSIYYLMGAGVFPKPIRLGNRTVGWRGEELADWVDSRPRGGCFAPGDKA